MEIQREKLFLRSFFFLLIFILWQRLRLRNSRSDSKFKLYVFLNVSWLSRTHFLRFDSWVRSERKNELKRQKIKEVKLFFLWKIHEWSPESPRWPSQNAHKFCWEVFKVKEEEAEKGTRKKAQTNKRVKKKIPWDGRKIKIKITR